MDASALPGLKVEEIGAQAGAFSLASAYASSQKRAVHAEIVIVASWVPAMDWKNTRQQRALPYRLHRLVIWRVR